MAVRAVIFDCFGVLWSDKLAEVFTAHTNGDPDKHNHFLALCHKADYGEISAAQFWQKIADLMGVTLETCHQMVDADRHLNVELLQYIREDLRGRYKIGLLSNACADIWAYVTPDIQELFDTLVISADIRRCKPDQEVYLEVCRRLEVSPEEAVFVDDRIENCIGAKQTGMQSLQYHTFTQLRAELSDALVVL